MLTTFVLVTTMGLSSCTEVSAPYSADAKATGADAAQRSLDHDAGSELDDADADTARNPDA